MRAELARRSEYSIMAPKVFGGSSSLSVLFDVS
jgi:hypothetical protein